MLRFLKSLAAHYIAKEISKAGKEMGSTVKRQRAIGAIQQYANEMEAAGVDPKAVNDWVDKCVSELEL